MEIWTKLVEARSDSVPSPSRFFSWKINTPSTPQRGKPAQNERDKEKKGSRKSTHGAEPSQTSTPLQVSSEGQAAGGITGLWKTREEKQLLLPLPAVPASPGSPTEASRGARAAL